jgi:lactose/L-arabinose transport system permease protein
VNFVADTKTREKKGRYSLEKKESRTGWAFLTPAVVLLAIMSFYPMVRALILSFQTGVGKKMVWAGISNYTRMFQDKLFLQSLGNTFLYLLIQVPIMLVLALILATMLNNKNLKCKGLFRTLIFLPCATSLVSYAIIFRSLFANDGFVNRMLLSTGIISSPVAWLTTTWLARLVIILALVWRWTGYNMVFYLAGLQNIDYSVYEAAAIDGASPWTTFWKITAPLLKPTILLTAIMSTNGTLQLFDESVNLTNGGPANSTMTMSHYIYNLSFQGSPNFGYASALAFVILILVAILAFVQMKVGDSRD